MNADAQTAAHTSYIPHIEAVLWREFPRLTCLGESLVGYAEQ
jgi:hypothetical protein